MVLNLEESRAKGLVSELVDTGKAIEAYHQDVKADIFQSLNEPTESKAYQALFDNSIITETDNLRSRWNGPYVRAASVRNPQFGDMTLQKRGPDHTQPCEPESLCFLWLVYGNVKPEQVKQANIIVDGEAEQNPGTTGRLQWSQNDDKSQILYFRATKALIPEIN